MTHHHENELKAAEIQYNQTIDRMTRIKQDFIQSTIKFFQTWYIDTTKQKATAAAKLTQQLGRDKLSKMKNEVGSLQGNAPQIVDEMLNDIHIWWHLRNESEADKHFKDKLQKSLRLIAGMLGPVLEKYGYITRDPNDPAYWREWDDFGLQRPPNARPYYPHHLDWMPEMIAMADEYTELMREAVQYSWEAKKLKEEKAQIDVEDLWKSA